MKKFLGLFFLIALSEASAFKYAPEFTRLIDRPISGKTLAVGSLVEDEAGEQFFIGERGWTFFPDKVHIAKLMKPNQKRVKRGVVGEKQIFYSVDETSPDGKINTSIYHITKLSSDKGKKIIADLADRQNFSSELNPSWQFCESDKECVQVKNQCGNNIGVNSRYKKNYLDFLKMRKEKVDCSKKSISASVSKCMESFCS